MTLAIAISQVNQSETTRSELISKVFNNMSLKKAVMNYVIKNGGNTDDASIVFSDMIVQFVKTAFSKKTQIIDDGNLDAYLFTIAKYIWISEIKKKGKENLFKDAQLNEEQAPSVEKLFLNSERYSALHNVLDKLRNNCKAVLMHWGNGYSMQEIADKLGYLSEGMARKKKSQCMAELNEFLMNNPQLKLQLQ
jgi:RNA polymerase sigma factor (sigma-70 family)